MRLRPAQQMTVLASGTGLALAAIWFGGLWLGAETPAWLPPMIGAVGGFELFKAVHERALRRNGGRRG